MMMMVVSLFILFCAKEYLLNLPLNARAINAINVYIIKQYSLRQDVQMQMNFMGWPYFSAMAKLNQKQHNNTKQPTNQTQS